MHVTFFRENERPSITIVTISVHVRRRVVEPPSVDSQAAQRDDFIVAFFGDAHTQHLQ